MLEAGGSGARAEGSGEMSLPAREEDLGQSVGIIELGARRTPGSTFLLSPALAAGRRCKSVRFGKQQQVGCPEGSII